MQVVALYSCGIFSRLLICPLVVKFLWATSPSTWSCSGFFTSEDLRQHRCNLRSSQVFTNLYSIWNRPMDHSCGQKLHVLLFARLFRHRPRSAGFEEHKGKMRSPSSQLPQIGAQEPGNNESRSLLSKAQPTVDFTARVLFAYNLHRVGQLPWALHQEVITTLLWTYSILICTQLLRNKNRLVPYLKDPRANSAFNLLIRSCNSSTSHNMSSNTVLVYERWNCQRRTSRSHSSTSSSSRKSSTVVTAC